MYMKEKGFTLVELLSVIVIMGIILLVAIPSVFGISKVVKDNMFCTKVHNIENAAKLYGSDYKDDFDDKGYVKVDIKTIIDNNLYRKEIDGCSLGDENNGCVVDPRDYSVMDNKTVTIVKTGQRYYAYYDFDKEEDIVLCEGKKETDKYKHYDVTLENQGATYPYFGTTIVRDVEFGHEMPNIEVPRKIYTVTLIDKLTNYYREEKVEYIFRGYFAAKNGGVKYYDENGLNVHYYDLPDGRPLYAVWTDKSVNIPKRTFTGYVFQGWLNAENDGDLIIKSGNYTPTSNIKLYAGWIPLEVELTLNSRSATFKGTEKVTAKYNEELEPITKPQKEYTVTLNYNGSGTPNTALISKYDFDGYAATTSPSSKRYYDSNGKGIEPSKFTDKATLYAIWKNGSITLPNASRPGYKFNGWYTAATGGTKVGDAGASFNPSKNITLYAQWKVSDDSMLLYGYSFNREIKKLANPEIANVDYNYDDYNIKGFARSNALPDNVNKTIVSVRDSETPIYAWFDNGIIYLYTEGLNIYINTDAQYMFRQLQGISNLDLSIFDSSKTNYMYGIFYNCSNLQNINLTSLNTKNVTSMSRMFADDVSLKSLDMRNFDTSNVTDMSYMFYRLDSLTSLNVSHFDTSNVTNMGWMFDGLKNLKSLDVRNFDTSNVTSMSSMFAYDKSLTSLDLSGFNTTNVKSMYSMFSDCEKLSSLNIKNFDTSNVLNMGWMFYNCKGLTVIDVSHFNTSNVKDMSHMFRFASGVQSLDLSSWTTPNLTSMDGMFNGCSKLTTLKLNNFNTSKVKNMDSVFHGCRSLTSLNLSNFDTSNVTDMRYMFAWCNKLTNLNISSFDTSNVVEMGGMFDGCGSLKSLDLRNFNTSNVVDMGMMFMECSSLTSLNVSSFDTSNVTNMGGMFEGCNSLTSLNILNFNTSKVKDMTGMFDSMWKIKVLDLSNFDTSSLEAVSDNGVCGSHSCAVTSGNYDMFGEMYELTTVYVGSKWDTSKVQASDTVFVDSKKIRGGNGTRYNSSHTGTDYMRIDGVGGPGYLTRK